MIGATVAVQWEDRGLWTHGVTVKPNNDDHRGYSYIMQVMKTGRLTMLNLRIYTTTP